MPRLPGEEQRVGGSGPMNGAHVRRLLGEQLAADVKCPRCRVSEMAADLHVDEQGALLRLVCARCGAQCAVFALAEGA